MIERKLARPDDSTRRGMPHAPTARDEDKAEEIGPPVVDACNALQPEWRATLIRFHDRLMFATDAHKAHRWSNYARIVDRWRGILGQLPPEVAQDIADKNAQRLYGR
ncbi:amidohydrolase family protein [Cupriavidus sp. 30B13]|uniref:amidohydrolase family protein n=1 Tax=Cupriavidus sp. 30B13 TaxID=3384241 RepID=UPI003B915DA4